MNTPTSSRTILRMRQMTQATGLSRSTIYNYLNPNSCFYDDTFPKPLRLGRRAVGWVASEVFRWIAERKRTS